MGIIFVCIFRLAPPFNRIVSSLNSIRFIKISVDLLSKENKNLMKNFFKINKNFKKVTFNSLRFKSVNFDYVGKTNIFNNINFKINHGDKICIIGETGSGKSTLVNLILGLIRPSKGKIFK